MVFFKKSLIKSETEPTERVRVTKIDEQLKFGGGKDERSLVKTQINTQRGISHIRRFIWYIYYRRILTYSYLNIMAIYIRVLLNVWDLNDVEGMEATWKFLVVVTHQAFIVKASFGLRIIWSEGPHWNIRYRSCSDQTLKT